MSLGGLCTELFYIIIPTFFSYFFLFCYPYTLSVFITWCSIWISMDAYYSKGKLEEKRRRLLERREKLRRLLGEEKESMEVCVLLNTIAMMYTKHSLIRAVIIQQIGIMHIACTIYCCIAIQMWLSLNQ